MDRRLALGALVGATVGAATLGSIGSAPETGDGIDTSARSDERRRRRFVNVALRTHEDRDVRFYDDLIRGKTVLINFMYTTCKDDCSLTTANLALVQKALANRMGRDLYFYSITVDPEHDTPAVLAAYASHFGVGPGWLFLTGTAPEIKRLRRSLGDDPALEKGRSNHLGFIRLGIEPLERWAGCPAWSRPDAILRYLAWMEPGGQRPKFERLRV